MIVFNIKECTKCQIEKSILDFNYSKSGKFQVSSECKDCLNEYQKTYRENNKHNISQQRKIYRTTNQEKISEQRKQNRIKNKTKIVESRKKWYQKNKSKNNEYHKQYIKSKRKNDVLFRLKCSLRARLHHFVNKKNKTTLEYLGLSLYEYKIYLSKMFDNNMNWDNYGEWHIDHIIPLSSAKNEEELIRLFHYTNTQPLWAKDNLKKGNKI
jgi:hypothetical protein